MPELVGARADLQGGGTGGGGFSFVMYAGDGVGGGRGGGGNNRSSRNNHGFRDSVIRRATTRDLPEEGIIVEGTELQAPTPWHHKTNVAEQALAPA